MSRSGFDGGTIARVSRVLLDANDPTRLTYKEIRDSYGGVCEFMTSLGLKVYKDEDIQAALDISRALKSGDNESDEMPDLGEIAVPSAGDNVLSKSEKKKKNKKKNKNKRKILEEGKDTVGRLDASLPTPRPTRLNPKQSIQDVSIMFFQHMQSQSIETLRRVEANMEDLRELYISWRNENGHRGSYSIILRSLKVQKKFKVYKYGIEGIYGIFNFNEGHSFQSRIQEIKTTAYNWVKGVEKNKGGIEVSELKTDISKAVAKDQRKEYVFFIENNGKIERTLTQVDIISVGKHRFIPTELNLPLVFNPNQTREVKLPMQILEVGSFSFYAAFTFDNNAQCFCIGRKMPIQCGNARLHESLKATSTFKKAGESRVKRTQDVVDGEKPGVPGNAQAYVGPKGWDIPSAWRDKFYMGELSEHYQGGRSWTLPEYVTYQHRLLYTEEMTAEREMLQYNMEDVTMKPTTSLLRLTVPGLSENRPSVQYMDSVVVSKAGGVDTKRFRGYCHQVERDSVLLKFSANFHNNFIANSKWDVYFELNRSVIRAHHHGLQLCDSLLKLPNGENIILPVIDNSNSLNSADLEALKNVKIKPINRNINGVQARAVSNIVNTKQTQYPYIIFGPPGTGKTTTCVEAIQQFRHMHPDTRVLVSAPSNSAADALLERLSKSIRPSEMCRYNSYQRAKKDVSSLVMEYSLSDSNQFIPPTYEQLTSKFKVVVATCTMACKLTMIRGTTDKSLGKKIERGHFGAIFIDEAGHAVEPEIVSAFAGVLEPSSGRLVLAGDPKQLGPIVRSDSAKQGGLEMSYIERLMTNVVGYKQNLTLHPDSDGFNPSYITKLLDCYRCHAEILKVPNELFYENQLRASADSVVTDSLLHWDGLLNRKFPLIFSGVQGKCEREGSDPSFFNISEIEKVLYYIKTLVQEKKAAPYEIGVITPYRKHAAKILRAMSILKGNYEEVLVGTCEKFQGQERKVIIISTVRSSTEYLESDQHFDLGFVKHPKRFNVAITRAKALLITIGNPHILSKDPNWSKLLRFCKVNNAYEGCEFEFDDDDDDDDNNNEAYREQNKSATESGGKFGSLPAAFDRVKNRLMTIFNTEANSNFQMEDGDDDDSYDDDNDDNDYG